MTNTPKTFYDNKITIVNNDGEIIACLYIVENGNLHPDSWLSESGRIPKEPED